MADRPEMKIVDNVRYRPEDAPDTEEQESTKQSSDVQNKARKTTQGAKGARSSGSSDE